MTTNADNHAEKLDLSCITGGTINSTATVKNHMAVLTKLNMHLPFIQSGNCSVGYLYQRIEKFIFMQNLWTNFHNSFIYNCQNLD